MEKRSYSEYRETYESMTDRMVLLESPGEDTLVAVYPDRVPPKVRPIKYWDLDGAWRSVLEAAQGYVNTSEFEQAAIEQYADWTVIARVTKGAKIVIYYNAAGEAGRIDLGKASELDARFPSIPILAAGNFGESGGGYWVETLGIDPAALIRGEEDYYITIALYGRQPSKAKIARLSRVDALTWASRYFPIQGERMCRVVEDRIANGMV